MISDEINAICLLANVDEIKSYIDRREELGLTVEEVFNLIKATKDVEYIDSIISDEEKRRVLDLYGISNLIQATGDIDYIKSCIERRKELELDPINDVFYLINETGDIDYIKQCINQQQELEINSFYLVKLIKATNDINYIKSIIENEAKSETIEIELPDMIELIKDLGDIDYIKSIVEDKEKQGKIGFHSPHQVVDLIISTKNIEYIKECIYKWRELKLPERDVATLIKSTKDIDFMKKYVEERKELELSPFSVRDLIVATRDINYMKNIIGDKATREELRLDSFFVSELIKETEDIDYIKSCIEVREELGLNLYHTIQLVETAKCDEWIENFLQSIETTKASDNSRLINLPNDMTIGIEIESEGENCEAIEKKLTNRIAKDWKCKHDGTLMYGAEVTSPILTGDMKQASASIRKVCNRLQGLRTNNI